MTLVDYRPSGAVGFLILSRPAKLNALNAEMLTGIGAALDSFLADAEAKVLIVRGEGRSFCAGIDVSPGSSYGTSAGADDLERLRSMATLWLRFWDSPKPVIAQIHGHCLAGAVQLPLCCDIVTVAEDAVVGAPKLPMGAGWIGPMLAHRIGVQRAKLFMFQIGYELTGREAYDIGLAALIAPAERLAAETEALARRIAMMPADLLRMEKRSINSVAEAAGFRAATYTGTLWDALSHTSAGVVQAKELMRTHGVKGAVARYSSRGAPMGDG
jgi:enoyl-CoA hydratase